MIDTHFRNRFDKVLVNPLLHFMTKCGMQPKTITLLSLISGVFCAPSLLFHHTCIALCCLLVSGYLDTLDGALARFQKKTSATGAAFDIVSDRFVEFSVVIGLYLFSPETRGLVSIVMMGSILVCVTSFLVVGIFEKNEGIKGFYYSPGIMERAEAFFLFSLMILFPGKFAILAVLFSVLVFLTAFIRLYQFQKV